MVAFEELEEFEDDVLELPIQGKTYVVEAVDGETGLWAQRIVETVQAARQAGDVDAGRLSDGDERILCERMLGSALREMLDDGVKWPRISHAGMTVFFWTTMDRETAEKYWKSGGNPEAARSAASTPQRGSRRASEGAANTTRKQGSGSGTKASPTKARPTRGSAGRTSSASGS